ncbi:unnamed protein product [Triticum turgidum subsp. durum]|uniref:NAC domain-containing protein n=1 Tax=Triticum turgidum subsp. durum TaxID=4567 RepID=A0A9R0S0J8_TRITD|nr:unnamed protein product [Triticum turgidum subsp. durum]
MAAMDHAPPGFRFTPTPEELINFYLDLWVADPGKTPVFERQGIVCVADIYGEDPAALTSRHRRFGHDDGNWYFLCVTRWKGAVGGRASRTVRGGGTWHGYGKRVTVAGAGHRVHQTTRTAADGEEVERGESSKAARSSKRRRRREHDMPADAKDELTSLEMFAMEEEKPEPLEHIFTKDEPESREMLAMEDEAEPWELITMEDELEPLQMLTNNVTSPQEMLTNNLTWPLEMLTNSLPWPLEMLTNKLTCPLEMLTNNLASPLETLTKNLPEPVETFAKNDLPSPLEILTKNLPEPLENLTKEDEPEPLDAEEPTRMTTTTFDQDSGAANKEAIPNAEMEMPADAEWNYPELFEQREPPPMEDIMKPLPAPTVQEFEQGAPPAAVQEFGGAAWGWGGHGRRCLVRPISLAWILPCF